MIVKNGYSIQQIINDNTVIIHLPQTISTLNSSASGISNRKLKLTSDEEDAILTMVEALYERGSNGQDT